MTSTDTRLMVASTETKSMVAPPVTSTDTKLMVAALVAST